MYTVMDVAYLDKRGEVSEIYGLAWDSFARVEMGELAPGDETLTSLRLILEDVLRSGNMLPYLLYDRRTGVGVLLSAYVLSKLGSKPSLPASDLKKVIDIVKEWDWYSFDGEALFALYLLSRVRRDVVERGEILNKIDREYGKALAQPVWSEATAEDVSRAIFTVLAHVYDKECEESTIKFLLDSGLFSSATRYLDLLAVYCFTLARCIRRMSARLRRKMFVELMRALRLASGALRNSLKLAGYQKLRARQVIRRDLEAKVELAKHELGNAIKQLQKLGREEREKRLIASVLFGVAVAMLIYTAFFTYTPFHRINLSIIQINIQSANYCIASILLDLAAEIHPSFKGIAKLTKIAFEKVTDRLRKGGSSD